MILAPTLLDALRKARHVEVFTSARVFAENGIATCHDRLTGRRERFDAASLATAEAFPAP
jgi:NAD-dependent deacetylase